MENTILFVLVTAMLSFFAGRREWRIASSRATLNLVLEKEVHDEFWSRIRHDAESLLEDPEHDKKYWEERIKAGGDDVVTVRALLNHYELIAIGIRHKIISGKFYEEWSRTVLINNWKRSKAFIAANREVSGRDAALREFQKLGERWSRNTMM